MATQKTTTDNSNVNVTPGSFVPKPEVTPSDDAVGWFTKEEELDEAPRLPNDDALTRAITRWPDWDRPFIVPDHGYGDWLWKQNRQKALTVTDGSVRCFSEEDDAVRASLIKAMSQFEVPNVSGTKEFRRKAWFMAQEINLEIKGYKPTAEDLALRAKIQAQSTASPSVDAKAPDVSVGGFTEHGVKPSAQPQTPKQENQAPTQKTEGVFGVLVEHGEAPYMHDEKNKQNYYVQIKDDQGQLHTLWGVDLERCLKDSNVQPGERIALKRDGYKLVSVPKLDEKGIPLKDEHDNPIMIETKRNTWEVTRVDNNNRPVTVSGSVEHASSFIPPEAGHNTEANNVADYTAAFKTVEAEPETQKGVDVSDAEQMLLSEEERDEIMAGYTWN